jgi:diaminohydroxyphosphoribosylaminopyrimidine deaminase/5-amino-6-(5-phosphoribosylamino)uracil reductase
MKAAINLGLRGRGFTEPNPLVGALVVDRGKIISTGFHRSFGGPHAEAMALETVSRKNTTLYVPLEPCCHYGINPPCTDLIIRKEVKRVVIALQDPNPRVNGKGIESLEKNGIRVDQGCLDTYYSGVNRHYFKYITRKIPYVTLKAGMSLDGKLTDKHHRSRWMTDAKLRMIGHSLRGEFSAVLIGSGTAREDDPGLNIRERGWGPKKLYRVVLDTHNQLDEKMKLFQQQQRFPLILFSSENAKNRTPKIDNHYFIKSKGDALDLKIVLRVLARLKIASVLVEGGGQVINSFLNSGLADELILFTASKIVGGSESVDLCASGVPLSKSIRLIKSRSVELNSGYMIRGYLNPSCKGG